MNDTSNATAAALLAVIDRYVEAASNRGGSQQWLIDKLRQDVERTVALVAENRPLRIETREGDMVIFTFGGRMTPDAEQAFVRRWEERAPGMKAFVVHGGMSIAAVMSKAAWSSRG